MILKLSEKKLDLLKDILSLDEIGEYIPEQIEDGNWTKGDLKKFNEILVELGLEEIEAYEDEGE